MRLKKRYGPKNARLLTISLVGITLIALIYWQVTGVTFSKVNDTVELPKLTEAQPAEEIPDAKPAPATATDPAPDLPKVAEPPVAIAKTAKVEPEAVKPAPASPVNKKEEPVISKTSLEEPKPLPMIRQPAKTQSSTISTAKKYFVQLGLFSIEANANGLAKRIMTKGFKPIIEVKSIIAERVVVFVGGFPSRESASQVFSDLKTKGFNSVIEKLADDSYTIVLGKFVTLSQAEALRDKLSVEGFLSSSRKSKVNSNTYVVQLGGFSNLPQAKLMQKKIAQAGFNDSFIR